MAVGHRRHHDLRRDRPDQRRGVLLRGPCQRRGDQHRPADGHAGRDAEGRRRSSRWRPRRRRVKWGGKATLTGELTDGAAPFASGQQVRLEWSYDGSLVDAAADARPDRAVHLRCRRPAHAQDHVPAGLRRRRRRTPAATSPHGDGDAQGQARQAASRRPASRRASSSPPTATSRPKATAGSHTVKIKCYQKKSGAWKLKKTVTDDEQELQVGTRATRPSSRCRPRAAGSWWPTRRRRPSTPRRPPAPSYLKVK